MNYHREALKTAIELGAVSAELDALVGIAESMVEANDKARAAEILALVLCYPINPFSRETAEVLFAELELELCPRVIADARLRAQELTLDDLALEVLAELPEED